jgi:hypothetical protein
MSSDEKALLTVVRAAAKARLEFVLVGNAAAALHDVPILTRDFDLFVRDTPRNWQEIGAFARTLGGVVVRPYEPVSRMARVQTPDVAVDFVFRLSSRREFESVRAAALRTTRELAKERK